MPDVRRRTWQRTVSAGASQRPSESNKACTLTRSLCMYASQQHSHNTANVNTGLFRAGPHSTNQTTQKDHKHDPPHTPDPRRASVATFFARCSHAFSASAARSSVPCPGKTREASARTAAAWADGATSGAAACRTASADATTATSNNASTADISGASAKSSPLVVAPRAAGVCCGGVFRLFLSLSLSLC